MCEWSKSKIKLCFEKTKVEYIYTCDGYEGSKFIVTKEVVKYDEINKKCQQFLIILDNAYEYYGCKIPITMQINEDKIYFQDESEELYTTYKLYRA